MQSEINIKVGNKAPDEYFDIIRRQMQGGNNLLSGIVSEDHLLENLKMNCIPPEIQNMSIDNYFNFLI